MSVRNRVISSVAVLFPAGTYAMRKLFGMFSTLKACGLFRSLSDVPSAIGMSSRAGQLPPFDDKILRAYGEVAEPAFQNFASPRCIPRLGRKRGPGNMRGHAVMRHLPP